MYSWVSVISLYVCIHISIHVSTHRAGSHVIWVSGYILSLSTTTSQPDNLCAVSKTTQWGFQGDTSISISQAYRSLHIHMVYSQIPMSTICRFKCMRGFHVRRSIQAQHLGWHKQQSSCKTMTFQGTTKCSSVTLRYQHWSEDFHVLAPPYCWLFSVCFDVGLSSFMYMGSVTFIDRGVNFPRTAISCMCTSL